MPAPSLVQGPTKGFTFSTVSTLQVAYVSNVTAGNLLTCQFDWGDGTTAVTSVTDSLGQTWTQGVLSQASTNSMGQWYKLNTLGGACTVTVTWPTTVSSPELIIEEWTPGSGNNFSLDGTPTGSSGSGTTPTSGNMTITGANDVLIGAVASFDAQTGAVGWTFYATDLSNGIETKIVAASGSYAATFGVSSAQWVANITGFLAGPTALLPGASGTLKVTAVVSPRYVLRPKAAGTIATSGRAASGIIFPKASGSLVFSAAHVNPRLVFRPPRLTGTLFTSGRTNNPLRPFLGGGNLGSAIFSGSVHGRLNTPNKVLCSGTVNVEYILRVQTRGTIATSGSVRPEGTGALRPLASGTIAVPGAVTARLNPTFPQPPAGTITLTGAITPRLGNIRPNAAGLAIVTGTLTTHPVTRPVPAGSLIVSGGLTFPRTVLRIIPPAGSLSFTGVVAPHSYRYPHASGLVSLSSLLTMHFTGVNRPMPSGLVSIGAAVLARYNPLRPFNVGAFSTLTVNVSGSVIPRASVFVSPPITVSVTGYYGVETKWGGWDIFYLTANVDYQQFIQTVLVGPFKTYWDAVTGLQTYFAGPPFNLPPLGSGP